MYAYISVYSKGDHTRDLPGVVRASEAILYTDHTYTSTHAVRLWVMLSHVMLQCYPRYRTERFHGVLYIQGEGGANHITVSEGGYSIL